MLDAALLRGPFTFTPQYKCSDYDVLRQSELDASSHSVSVEGYTSTHTSQEGVDEYNNNLKTLGGLDFIAQLNNRQLSRLQSYLNIGRTLFICMVLTCGAMLFSKDANDLALRPIERMIDKVCWHRSPLPPSFSCRSSQ